ncbi:MAG: magnesium transporter [Deltaproteobacteria bacterium]|nr:magnesium transporter [Deltaproteobacteria bacterium]
MLSKKMQVLTETVKKLLHCHADENLKNILAKAHEADIAFCLAQLNVEEQVQVFALLQDAQKRAKVLSELQPDQVASFLQNLGAQKAADILNLVSPDDAADILEKLADTFSSEILLLLKKEEAAEVESLIRYRPDTAGGIMSPEVFSLPEDLTVAEAIEKIQQSRDVETVFYVYVVNPQGHLVGALSLKKLILAPPKTLLRDIIDKDPIRVRLGEDQEEVARIVSRYNFLSLPVVDEANKLVGVITVDDVIDVIKEEATEDILLMTGAEKEAMEKTGLKISLKKRMPWFLVTLVGGFMVSEVIDKFSSSLVRVSLLAGFIPLLLSMGGSMGTQSMVVVMSSLNSRRMNFVQVWSVVFKEFKLALIMGVFYGLVLALFIYLRYGEQPHLPLALGSVLVLTMILSVAMGTFIPLLFQKMGVDPAVATGPFVTTSINIFCMWIYLSIATHFIIIAIP